MLDLYRNYEDLVNLQDKIDDQIYELEDIFSNKQDDWDKKEISRLLGGDMPILYDDEIIHVSDLPDEQLFVYVDRYTESQVIADGVIPVALFEFNPIRTVDL